MMIMYNRKLSSLSSSLHFLLLLQYRHPFILLNKFIYDLVKQNGIVGHNATCTIINRISNVFLSIANPIVSHNASFPQMTDQWLDHNVEQVQYFKICMSLPIIPPFSNLPLVKFLSEQRELHANLFNENIGQQSCDIKEKQVVKFLVIHPAIAVRVSFPQNILHLTSNSNNRDIFSLIFVDQSMQFIDCTFRWSLQFNVQRHLWECLENLFKCRHLLFIGANNMTLSCKVQLDFWFKRRQILKIVIPNETLDSACPYEFLVMMDDQNSIFSLANVQLEHITMLCCIFEGFNGILRDISWATAMSYSQNFGPVYGLLEALSPISEALMKQSWEKEQKNAEGNITSEYENEGDPDHQW